MWGIATPQERMQQLHQLCQAHIEYENSSLYRIFYYDCWPLEQEAYHPLLQRNIDLMGTEQYQWAVEFYEELKKIRKMALRFGRLHLNGNEYTINPKCVRKIYDGALKLDDLKEHHFTLPITQKGVDMRIGLDIASIAFKQQVDQMVLISGDSDFIPIAKHARREGVEFILDPMEHWIKPELGIHLDEKRNLTSSVKPKLTYTET